MTEDTRDDNDDDDDDKADDDVDNLDTDDESTDIPKVHVRKMAVKRKTWTIEEQAAVRRQLDKFLYCNQLPGKHSTEEARKKNHF